MWYVGLIAVCFLIDTAVGCNRGQKVTHYWIFFCVLKGFCDTAFVNDVWYSWFMSCIFLLALNLVKSISKAVGNFRQ